jgi:plasmid stabilization system protein ParE
LGQLLMAYGLWKLTQVSFSLWKLSQTFVYLGNNLRKPFHGVRRRSSYRDHAIISVAATYGDSPEVPILHQAQSRC